MKNRFLTFSALSAVIISLSGCMNTVESMNSDDYVAAIAPAYEETTANSFATESPTQPSTEAPTESLEMPDGYTLTGSCQLNVDAVLQNPELPTGCEVTALTTVLNYNGFEIDKVELCDNFLPIDLYAEYTFDEAYVGNPKLDNGFGCNAPVIVETAELYFESIGESWKGLNLTGTDFQELFYQIEKGRPVIVWSSMGLKDVTFRLRWTTDDGDEAWFAELEHCMVLTGYDLDSGIVYVADPLKGNMEYSLERFEDVYDQMGKQAVILYEQEHLT